MSSAGLAQSVERTTLNRVVVGSIPTFGVLCLAFVLDRCSIREGYLLLASLQYVWSLCSVDSKISKNSNPPPPINNHWKLQTTLQCKLLFCKLVYVTMQITFRLQAMKGPEL